MPDASAANRPATEPAPRAAARRGIRSVQSGLAINALLAIVKAVAGVFGNTHVLVADALESTADIAASMIVWTGLHVATRDPDEEYPFGYGRAEALSASIVSLLLLGAALWIAREAVREIQTPHHAPAPWTLAVLMGVLVIKWMLFHRVLAVGTELSSTAVRADAWHHASDAFTSLAAFIGISIALIGGEGWEAADDWAALLASGVIAWNGIQLVRAALVDLMDRAPGEVIVGVRQARGGVAVGWRLPGE